MSTSNINNENYINRELSWIDFNKRVLELAIEEETPLLEKIKFSSIFSNNLDEFFMVRVASLKSQVDGGISKKSQDGRSAEEQLDAIRNYLDPILDKQQSKTKYYIQDEFKKNNLFILEYKELNEKQKVWIDNYFTNAIFPILTPLAVDPAHPFPFISNLSLNLAAIIFDRETEKEQFTRIKIPGESISRFISIPIELDDNQSAKYTGIAIEQIIANNLIMLFPGMEVKAYSFFRVTRDADLELRDLEADDLMSALEEGLRKRRKGGEVVRLEVSSNTPEIILDLLQEGMHVEKENLYQIEGLLALDELIELTAINLPKLKFKEHQGITHNQLKNSQLRETEDLDIRNKNNFKSIFSIIRRNDLLVHHPYNLFSTSVEEFINQAAEDSQVMGIKMTLYRISKDSLIIDALIRAAEKGKQVMALVELKARFDEDNNIQWAKQLEQSGVHVVYGVIGLKTHTKIALVIRKEKNRLRSYFHIGTGNYNSKTSKTYTDLGLLSCQPELGQDLIELFNYLTGFAKQQSYRKLLVAPVTLRHGIEKLIKREIKHAKTGLPAKIIAKMNSLVDPEIIKLLYEASREGVQIELIIRGMCCLYPQKKGLSENIKVKSIIGRFLEHSRIFWFNNDGNAEVFIGSADWMRRNLDRRVEAVTPIEDNKIKKEIKHLLDSYIEESKDCWIMQSDGSYIKNEILNDKKRYLQEKIIKLYKKEAN
ncbi:polyphosphate kinase 1 [Prochlorococcus marinus]|uniref:Polyphosphate kinase n=1 Tax=Prochlorococcus marinus XMU1408 TaxID=2213228 RepID=A0A318R137_PROMR|nr:polyphosphate kinase 1 [Prochlorococcus marinus]MBW3042955.1 polyphosphate kinase 1 [Prochlorococcus marinus str. XMU1408]PYE00307.1 polyphosphate kinase 1 [Prochlorococcus marinus XMU1408]